MSSSYSGTPDVGIRRAIVRRLRDQVANERAGDPAPAHLRAGELCVECVFADRFPVGRRGSRLDRDQGIVGSPVAGHERPLKTSCCRRDEFVDHVPAGRNPLLHSQCMPRLGRPIEIQLDEAEVGHAGPVGVGTRVLQQSVRLERALYHLPRGVGSGHARTTAAHQRRRNLQTVDTAALACDPLRPGDHRLANGVHQIAGMELPLFTQTGDDDGWRAPLDGATDVAAAGDEDLMRPWGIRIEARVERVLQDVCQRPVDNGLGAGQPSRAIVPQEERRGLEAQIAVGDRHAQRCFRHALGRRFLARGTRTAARERRGPGAAGGITQQSAIRQRLRRVDRAQPLWRIGERIDEEVDSLLVGKDIEVRRLAPGGDVAAGTEAADPHRRNERLAGTIDAPGTFGGHHEIVGAPEKLVASGIEKPLQDARLRMIVGGEREVRRQRRPGRPLDRLDHGTRGAHRMKTRKLTAGLIGHPDDGVCDKGRATAEGVIGKHFQQVGQPADRLGPPIRIGERRTLIGHRYQDGLTETEPGGCPAEGTRALDERSQHETAARVGDDIEGRRPVGQPFEQHSCVLFRRSRDREVLECKHAIGVGTRGAAEEFRTCEIAERGRGARQRSMQQQERAIRCRGSSRPERTRSDGVRRDPMPAFLQTALLPDGPLEGLRQPSQRRSDRRLPRHSRDPDGHDPDGLALHSSRRRAFDGHAKPRAGRPAGAPSRGLDGKMKGQRPRRQPDRQNSRLARGRVARQIKRIRVRRSRPGRAPLQQRFLDDPGFERQKLRRQAWRQLRRMTRRSASADGLDCPPGRVELQRHGGSADRRASLTYGGGRIVDQRDRYRGDSDRNAHCFRCRMRPINARDSGLGAGRSERSGKLGAGS